MNPLDAHDESALETVARRHGFSMDATRAMFDSVMLGNGSMAQFSHPEFGGSGQWMRGGMTMVGDMFNHRLKASVDALCTDLAALAASRSRPAASGGGGGGDGPTAAPREGGYAAGGGRWWPGELGVPNASGAQNGARYAYFAEPRRLAIESGGQVTVYDTGEHRIAGVSQQQSSGSSLRFTSQLGAVEVDRLAIVHPGAGRTAAAAVDQAAAAARQTPPQPTSELPPLIEKLAELRAKGILTEEEFSAKKAELLSRI